MKKLVASLAVALLIGGCAQGLNGPVPADVIKQAQTIKYGLDTSYAASLRVATTWADKANRCTLPNALPPPLCSTAQGVLRAEAARLVARSALDRLEMVIATATTASAIDAALNAAKSAVAAYTAAAGGQ